MADGDIFADLLSSLQPPRSAEQQEGQPTSSNDAPRSGEHEASAVQAQESSEGLGKMPPVYPPLKKEEIAETMREITKELLFQSLGALTNTMRTSLAQLSERMGEVEKQCQDVTEGLAKLQAVHEEGVERMAKSLCEVTTALRDTGTHLQRVVDKQELVDAHVMLTKLQQEKEVGRQEQKQKDAGVSNSGTAKDMTTGKVGGKDAPPPVEQPNPPTQPVTPPSAPHPSASEVAKDRAQPAVHPPLPVVSGATQPVIQQTAPPPPHQPAPAPAPIAPLPQPAFTPSGPVTPHASGYPQVAPQFQQQQQGPPPSPVQTPAQPVVQQQPSIPAQQIPPGMPARAPMQAAPQVAQPPMPPAPQQQRMPMVSSQQTILSNHQLPVYPGIQGGPVQQPLPPVLRAPLQQGPPQHPPQPVHLRTDSAPPYSQLSMGMSNAQAPYRQGFGPPPLVRPSSNQNPLQPPLSGEHGAPGTRTTTQSIPLEQVVNEVALMGFDQNRVRGIVTDMVNQGRSVDLNVVLDQLTRYG